MENEMKWTYDELITLYIAEKVRRGYEVSSTFEELANFLDFVTYIVDVENFNTSYDEIIKNYIHGRGSKKEVWNAKYERYDVLPIVKQLDATLIEPTYDLSYPLKMSNSNSLEVEKYEQIKYCLDLFLKRRCDRREIPKVKHTNLAARYFCYDAAAALTLKIWTDIVDYYISIGKWPLQCDDLVEYVINLDLASIIKLPSMRQEMGNFYRIINRRMLPLVQNDENFRMTNLQDEVLAKSNFDLIMEGLDYIPTVDRDGAEVRIDRIPNEMCEIFDRGEGIRTVTKLNDPKVKRLSDGLISMTARS